MAVALGADLDSVLCDNKETAKRCIQFLKENKCFPLNFYPLDSISCKPINEHFRKLGGSTKLAFDLVDFDPKFHSGFLSVCGNTLICESIEEAKLLIYTKKVNTIIQILVIECSLGWCQSSDHRWYNYPQDRIHYWRVN